MSKKALPPSTKKKPAKAHLEKTDPRVSFEEIIDAYRNGKKVKSVKG